MRAAGAATGRNPVTLLIPCHRIVGSDGALTGYAGGVDRGARCSHSSSCHAVGASREVACAQDFDAARDVIRLVVLAVIWSASFAVHSRARTRARSVWVAAVRLLLGGAALVLAFVAIRRHLDVPRPGAPICWWGSQFVAAVPAVRVCRADAASMVLLMILNAALPLFGAVASAVSSTAAHRREAGRARCRLSGVMVSRQLILAPNTRPSRSRSQRVLAPCCARAGGCLGEAFLAAALPSLAMAGWSQLLGGIALLPLAALAPVHGAITGSGSS